MTHSLGGHVIPPYPSFVPSPCPVFGAGHLYNATHHVAKAPRKVEVYQSRFEVVGAVPPFPPHTGEHLYMVPFRKVGGKLILPSIKLSRWIPTILAMLDGITTRRTMYLMIDQGEIKAGATHRRPGPHIDGNWVPDLSKVAKTHAMTFMYPETLVLASDVCASVGYRGTFRGPIGKGGDCSSLDLSAMQRVALKAGIAYMGNITFVHASTPVAKATKRTLVRINVPHHTF